MQLMNYRSECCSSHLGAKLVEATLQWLPTGLPTQGGSWQGGGHLGTKLGEGERERERGRARDRE